MTAITLHPPGTGGLGGHASGPNAGDDWYQAAACRGSDAGLFHGGPHEHRRAQAVCGHCPVAEVCLWWAMATEAAAAHPYRYGVWGATTPARRARMAEDLGLSPVEYGRLFLAALEAPQGGHNNSGASHAA